jgi:hypothetical protein
MTRRRLPILLCALVAGCATPRFYERQALVLDDASLRDVDVTWSQPGDCLWRQRWAGRYDIDRGPYRLALIPVLRYADEPIEWRLELSGEGTPQARVAGAPALEDPLAEGHRRYRVTPPHASGTLTISILRGDKQIGMEELSFHAERCRALLWRDG